jgi:hypothetical protein
VAGSARLRMVYGRAETRARARLVKVKR